MFDHLKESLEEMIRPILAVCAIIMMLAELTLVYGVPTWIVLRTFLG